MAKAASTAEAENPLATIASGPPPELAELAKAHQGKGLSTDQADNLVPLIYVLQGLSPQVVKSRPAYVEGAEPGAFWLRNAEPPIIYGNDGMIVQSCFFFKDWVEWVPRASGGGFVARHAPDDEDPTRCPVADATKTADPQNPNKVKFIRQSNGNEVIETRNHVVRVFLPDGRRLPFILPFSSTGHTTSRNWMTMMNTGGANPSCLKKYKLTTKERSNPLGTWFVVEVKDDGWVSTDDFKAGVVLHDAFAKGDKKAEAPLEAGEQEVPF